MGKLEFDRNCMEQTMDRIVERTMRMDMTWDWPCGVAYYGIAEAYEATGKQEYLDLMKERVDELISLGLPDFTVNTCAMGHALLTLYQQTGQEVYKDIIEAKLNYLEHEALRFGDHVLQHTVSADNDFPEQCWADTLFMAALFLLRSYGVFRIDVCSRYRLWRDWRQSKVYPRLDGWGPNPVRIWTGFTDVFRDSSRRA